MAIRSFRNQWLEEVFVEGSSRRIGKQFHSKLVFLLDHIHAAASLTDMVGVAKFHRLSGDKAGRYSMHVSGNYRLTFGWDDGPTDVDFEDYH